MVTGRGLSQLGEGGNREWSWSSVEKMMLLGRENSEKLGPPGKGLRGGGRKAA